MLDQSALISVRGKQITSPSRQLRVIAERRHWQLLNLARSAGAAEWFRTGARLA
jgi:hypothetical protein